MRAASSVSVALSVAVLASSGAGAEPLPRDTLMPPPGVEVTALERGPAVRISVRAGGREAVIHVVDADDRAPPPAGTKRSIFRGNLRADMVCPACTDEEFAALGPAAEVLAGQAAPLVHRSTARASATGTGRAIVGWLVLVLGALGWAFAATVRDLAAGPDSASMRTGLLVCVVVALALRLWVADGAALAADETWLRTFRSPWQYASTAEVTSNPPLYPTLAWPLLAGSGGDPSAPRLLSVAAGTLTVGLLGAVVFAWLGVQAGLVAAGLAALHPFLVATGAANRSYALALLVLVAAVAAMARALSEPSSRRRRAAALLAGALPWTHYGTWPAVAALGLWLVLDPRRGAAKAWVGPVVAAAVLALPAALLTAEGGRSKATEDFGTGAFPTAASLWEPGAAVLLGLEPPSILDHAVGAAGPLAQLLALVPLLALLLGGVAGVMRGAGTAGLFGAGLVGLAGVAWPLALAGRVATIRDLHFFVAVVPMIVGFAWLAKRRLAGWLVGVAAMLALLPGLAAVLAQDDPLGARAAGRLLRAEPALHAVVVGHAAATTVRREAGPESVDRVHVLSYCGRAPVGAGAVVIVVRSYCPLASLGFDPAGCRPMTGSPVISRCSSPTAP